MSTTPTANESHPLTEVLAPQRGGSGSGSGSDSGSAATHLKDTAKQEDDAAATTEPADPIASVLTNPDTLSRPLLFLDVPDVPSAARTCKLWNRALDCPETETTLWLGLIRTHRPVLERITGMLPDDVGDAAANLRPTDDIPPPSKRWKMQFKREVLIARHKCALPVKPLSSYFFEIRFSAREDKVPRKKLTEEHVVRLQSSLFLQEEMKENGRVHTVVVSAK